MLIPRNSNVLVELDKPSEYSEGGIYVQTNTVPDTGVVVACSCKVEDLSVGDKVYINQYMGKRLNLSGKDYVLIDEKEIYARE